MEAIYMTLEELKKFIEENKDNQEVSTYLQGLFPMTVEEVQKFVSENQDGRKWFDSEKDRHFSKGLETFKEKTMPSILDAEIKKRFPEKDAKDLELEKIKAELQKIQSEKVRESLTNKAIKLANEKKLPLDIVDFFISEDEDKTTSNLSKLEEVWGNQLKVAVEERLKSSTYVPPNNTNSGKTFTKEQLAKMSPDEINANWGSISKSLNQ
jgi:hypothetical protein